jgi:hypothetical protein
MSGAMRWRDSGHLERAVATAGSREAFDAAVSMLDGIREWRLAELRISRSGSVTRLIEQAAITTTGS